MKHKKDNLSEFRSSLLAQSTYQAPIVEYLILSNSVTETMGDNSFPDIEKTNIYKIVAKFTQKFKVIKPQNKILLSWHVIVIFILIYYIFEAGLLLGFRQSFWHDQLILLYTMNCVFVIVLIIDCFLCLFKAYYSMGILVTNHQLIAKRYLKIRFFIDVLSIISIAGPIIVQKFEFNWLKISLFLKIYQIYEIDKQFRRVTQLKVDLHTLYLLLRLLVYLVIGSHYLGIWFFMIDKWVYDTNYYGPNTPNLCWIYNASAFSKIVVLEPWYNQYLYSLYYSIGTMTTIANGDIVPLNPLSTLYTNFALVAYTIGFAYILSSILKILMEAQATKLQHTQNFLIVTNMMKDNLISQKTQSKVKSYFQQVWKQQCYRNRQIQYQLIQLLPQKTRNQLYNDLYHSFFQSLNLSIVGSQNIIKTNFMIQISNQIRQKRLLQDNILYKQQQQYDGQNINNHLFYYIKQLKNSKLKQSIQIGVKNITIMTLKDGQLGIQGFYTGDNRDHWAKVISSVLVYQLPRKTFLDHSHLLTQIQQQNVFLVTQNIYNRKCYICKKIGHNFKYCPYVTYQVDKKLLVPSADAQQFSSFYQRKTTQKIHYHTLIQYKHHKNIKYKINDQCKIMHNYKYYKDIINFQIQRKKIREIKKYWQQKSIMQKSITQKKAALQKKIASQVKPKKKQTGSDQRRMTWRLSTLLSKIPIIDSNIVQPNPPKEIQQLPFLQQLSQQQQQQPIVNQPPNRISKNPYRFSTLNTFPQQVELGYQLSESSSDQSSIDLQTYVEQTQFYVRHLQNVNPSTGNRYTEISNNDILCFDAIKQYKIYKPTWNMNQMLSKYNKIHQLQHISAATSFNTLQFSNNETERIINVNSLKEKNQSYQYSDVRKNKRQNESV